MIVNSKKYPLWGQFVEKKDEWIGGELIDGGDSFDILLGFSPMKTIITDIKLRPNGKDSAFFTVIGKDFECGFDVSVGGISSEQEDGYLVFYGYMGHKWKIKKKIKS